MEMPMDQHHAQELKKLKEQGLVKIKLDGLGQYEVITHRNIPNKISHDFNIKKYRMVEFVNRDPDRPTLCNLYGGDPNRIIETFLDEEDYCRRTDIEDQELEKYPIKCYHEG